MQIKPSVQLRDLAVGYVSGGKSEVVASGINADLFPHTLTCLLGSNGTGKSTLLRTIARFQPKMGGDVTVLGRRLETLRPREMAQTVGVVLTERIDMQQLSVRELVALGRQPHTGFFGHLSKEDEEVVDEAVSMVAIEGLSRRRVASLSDGERQKAMVAKALAQQTPIILLDEPTAFLDYPSKIDILLLLRRIAHEQGKTILLSIHDLELALQTADIAWLMEKGSGIAVGRPEALAASGKMKSFVEQSRNASFNESTCRISVRL